jgi:UDP-N-acetylmuramoyl-tripeptide--D-alanyl-D-alanine ligase
MELSLGEVATILGTACGAPERIARGYSIDSRTLSAGQLFFALRGRRFDGHQFVGHAFERGAVGAVVERAFPAGGHASLAQALLPVDSTTQALQQLANAVRRRWGRQLIAITGSTGKSTTKEMTAALLARRYSVLKSLGNLNNYYGLPLTLLALEPAHEVAVTELAMSAAGEIELLSRIAEPQMGVVTNVAPVHLEFFDSIAAIAQAKRELIDNLPSSGTAILNHDDERVRAFAQGFKGRVVSFGFEKGADFRALDLRPAVGGGTDFHVTGPGLDNDFHLPLPGRHNVQNALIAIAVATLFEVHHEDLQEGIATFQPLAQRSEILTLAGGITLIDDCYNSNPVAMEKMLETLAAWPAAGRRIVVAGEMLELGPTSSEWHRRIGRKCAETRVDWLLAVQGDARFFLEGAKEMGWGADRMCFFSTPEEAADFCRKLLRPGDVLLLKGSRGVHLEKVRELLQSSEGRRPVDSNPRHQTRRE